MEDTELTTHTEDVTNGEVDDESQGALLDNLKQLRAEATNLFGTTKVMEIPGYHGLLAIEYTYINAEVTEMIARDVRRETKNVNGIGMNLLASLDTLIAASKNVLIRKDVQRDWRPLDKEHQVNFKSLELARTLDYPASNSREVVLGVYGSEHSVIEANILLSRWLTDKTRTADEDFLG
jgi:hypothetical protein